MSFAAAYIPWTDRTGRFSSLRALTFAAILTPGLWLAWLFYAGELGARPVTAAIHDTGDWAVRFLLLSLLVSPLRAITRRNELIGIRRMLGLAGLGYVAVHACLYIVDQKWDLWKVASEIALRTYLTIGFAGLIGLALLGATSTDGMVKRLGAGKWNSLHRLVYLLTVLALVHFFLQRRLEIFEPVLMSGLFLWLMGWRALRRFANPTGLPWLTGLAIGAGAGVMLLEAAYLSIRHSLAFGQVLGMNLEFDYIIRPGWWVLAAGFGMAALAAGFARFRPAPPPRRAASAPPWTAGHSSVATTDAP